jgi:protein O-GlcNAc transferase
LSLKACAIALVLLLTSTTTGAQELPPALAERFSQGVAALKANDLDNAEGAFRDVLRAGGGRSFVHHNLGLVLRERGRHADALAEFRMAAQLDPSFGPARLLAGSSLLALGRPKEAIAELESASKLMPREIAAHLQLAEAYERTQNVTGVVDTYRRIVELAPNEPEYAYRLGWAYLEQSKWAHERMRAIDPKSARLSQALGREYLQQGRPDLAARAFEEAARLDPSLPEIHAVLARIHLEQGRLDDAARAIERELAIAPESREARELKARIDAARPKPQ